MQFGSKTRRAFLWTLLTMLVPDCVLAGAAAITLDGGILGLAGGVVALQVFHFVRWILVRVVDWAVFALQPGRVRGVVVRRGLSAYVRPSRDVLSVALPARPKPAGYSNQVGQ